MSFFRKNSRASHAYGSSFVSCNLSALAAALRANFGAMILDKFTCFSGGGPPLGCPRIINASPDTICFTIPRCMDTG